MINIKDKIMNVNIKEKINIINILKSKEIRSNSLGYSQIGNILNKRVDDLYNNLSKSIKTLKESIDTVKWIDIEYAVGNIITTLLSNNPNKTTHKNTQEREIFVILGGVNQILRLFQSPFLSNFDARTVSPIHFHRRSDLWNGIFFFLREICFSIPTLGGKIFTNNHISLFFTFLSHQSIFEGAINLLEEILSSRLEIFSLINVSNFYQLVDNFSIRELSHFCRVLSLLLFEPEDRQIMDSIHPLRSIELLQLRRNRLARVSNLVEKNQSLILKLPNIFEKFTQILKILNHGPTLEELFSRTVAQSPISQADILQYLSPNRKSKEEWNHFNELHEIINSNECNDINDVDSSCESKKNDTNIIIDSNSNNNASISNGSTDHNISRNAENNINMTEMFENLLQEQEINMSSFNMSGMMNMNIVESQPGLNEVNNNNNLTSQSESNDRNRNTAINNNNNNNNKNETKEEKLYKNAKKEIQFYAMILSPHQIELLFVLSTLLTGRRKLNIQITFFTMKLSTILSKMFDRMSWNINQFNTPNLTEHMHGPGCECNAETAVRVQFLRLLYNCYDRDFFFNSSKSLLLSPTEINYLNTYCKDERLIDKNIKIFEGKDSGLLTKLIYSLQFQESGSIYRYWLSSCIESYLRGSSAYEQIFVAKSGLISSTIKYIISSGKRKDNSLQTSFSLLGELVKYNIFTLELVEESLNDFQFRQFINILMDNITESNLFIRSLFLSMESISKANKDKTEYNTDKPQCNLNISKPNSNDNCHYLSHSWIQLIPPPISQKAVELFNTTTPINIKKKKMFKFKFDNSISSDGTIITKNIGDNNDKNIRNITSDASNFGRDDLRDNFKKLEENCNNLEDKIDLINENLHNIKNKRSDIPDISNSNNVTSIDNPIINKFDANSSNHKWNLPDSIYRLSFFLLQKKEHILYNLICEINIYTITYGNICCLNTTLLIFVLENKRLVKFFNFQQQIFIYFNFINREGKLSQLLQKIRKLADIIDTKNKSNQFDNSNMSDDEFDEYQIQDHQNFKDIKINQNKENNILLNSDKVMENLRQLLWYWSEYYLRRGRDRLSIEFSSHIPFHKWSDVVTLLCKDDGSPTAILKRPIKLPSSPYSRYPSYYNSSSSNIINFPN
jgi:hypothetical protein